MTTTKYSKENQETEAPIQDDLVHLLNFSWEQVLKLT